MTIPTKPGKESQQDHTVVVHVFSDDTRDQPPKCLKSLLYCLGIFIAILAVAIIGLFIARRVLLHRGRSHVHFCKVLDSEEIPDGYQQKMEVIPEQNCEKITTPSLGSQDPAMYVHDFYYEKTAIIDPIAKRCFIKDLDPAILPPTDMIDLLEKNRQNYYERNVVLTLETYQAVNPALTAQELKDLGSPVIRAECSGDMGFTAYKIIPRVDRGQRLKRNKVRDPLIDGLHKVVPKKGRNVKKYGEVLPGTGQLLQIEISL